MSLEIKPLQSTEPTTSCHAAPVRRKAKQVGLYTTRHHTRCSTGIISCYKLIQALGSPQYRNLII